MSHQPDEDDDNQLKRAVAVGLFHIPTELPASTLFFVCSNIVQKILQPLVSGQAQYCKFSEKVLCIMCVLFSSLLASALTCIDVVKVNGENRYLLIPGSWVSRTICTKKPPAAQQPQPAPAGKWDAIMAIVNLILIPCCTIFSDPLLSCLWDVNYEDPDPNDWADRGLYDIPFIVMLLSCIIAALQKSFDRKRRNHIVLSAQADQLKEDVDAGSSAGKESIPLNPMPNQTEKNEVKTDQDDNKAVSTFEDENQLPANATATSSLRQRNVGSPKNSPHGENKI
jgi:hypothetical protein